jgi:hypothetical protein
MGNSYSEQELVAQLQQDLAEGEPVQRRLFLPPELTHQRSYLNTWLPYE